MDSEMDYIRAHLKDISMDDISLKSCIKHITVSGNNHKCNNLHRIEIHCNKLINIYIYI